MTPAGRDRICARCDRAVLDLSSYEPGEVEALVRSDPQTCVRARVGADGLVALKPGRPGGARRMMVAAAATAGLLSAGAPAAAERQGPGGAIAGKVDSFGFRVRVTATGADGRTFRTRSAHNGRFRMKRIPPGAYRLTFVPDCGEPWTVEKVLVGDGETIVPNPDDRAAGCIIIGRLQIEQHRG
jgi:hypothetical protein